MVNRRQRSGKQLLLWIMLAYGLCLLPGGCFRWITSIITCGVEDGSFSGVGDLMEWTAHAVLIGGVAYSLFRLLRRRAGRLPSLIASMGLVLLIAISIEWLQCLLPQSFSRGFSWSDVVGSLLGGLIGVCCAEWVQLRFDLEE